MAERSWFWVGNTTGDAGGAGAYNAIYVPQRVADYMRYLSVYDNEVQGPIPTAGAYIDALEPSETGATEITIAAGAALVDGTLYLNTAALAVAVAGASNYKVIKLRKDHVNQTVRITYDATDYASHALALASLTHSNATYWDVPLCTFHFDAGGALDEMIDQRQYAIRPAWREAFVSPTNCWNETDGLPVLKNAATYGFPLVDNKLYSIGGYWQVSYDYSSGLSIKAVTTVTATKAVYVKHVGYLTRLGEDLMTDHIETLDYTAEAGSSITEMKELTFSADPAEPGDHVALVFFRNAVHANDTENANTYFVGWTVRYLSYY